MSMPDGAHTHPDLETRLDRLEERVAALETSEPTPKPPEPPIGDPFPVAWWGISNPTAIRAKEEAGFTHNIIWSADTPTSLQLDILHDHGIKAIVALRADIAEHPAIVAAIVADEPDNNTGKGIPKGSHDTVTNRTRAAKQLRPDLPIFSTFGSSCAAGDPESVPGYKSLSALPGDPQAIYDGYTVNLDFAAVQMYTVAADPVSPRYTALDGSATITAKDAGVRQPGFVPKGITRAKRLLNRPIWAQLACVKYRGDYGRNPTQNELDYEARAAIDGGCTGIFYFERGPAGWPTEPLIDNPAQLAAVTQTIATIIDT